jgi:hypothetical protein
MWPFDGKKIEPKATEAVPYQRIPKDGRSSTGFVKPKAGGMGNQNAADMMKQSEADEMNRKPKGK